MAEFNYNHKDTEKSCNLDMGRGCGFCKSDDGSSATACPGCYKLHAYNWMDEMPEVFPDDIFEIRFKNTRKGFYQNVNNLPLKVGDIVAVEASPGHDIGIVSMTGDLVARQMKRVGFTPMNGEFKKIYRKAKPNDVEKWQEAIALEHNTMIRSRQIAAELGLNMKIGDVEYQGDKIKAIFYYIADERVDFRELIKVFADQFRIRVEMKQIGARQEAGRIGGLGSCGRELCCASWISSFVSVTTNSARHQEISLNPQKLAGQCGKLKCCLVYELDTYLDARKDFPRVTQPLQAFDADYHLVKIDILSRTMWFSTDPHSLAGMKPLHVKRVKEILALNQRGQKVDNLLSENQVVRTAEPDFANVVGEESLTRFDNEPRSSRRKGRSGRGNGEKGENRAGRERTLRNSGDGMQAKPSADNRERNNDETKPNARHRDRRKNNASRPENNPRSAEAPRREETLPATAAGKGERKNNPLKESIGGNRSNRSGHGRRNERSKPNDTKSAPQNSEKRPPANNSSNE